jgi:hypothetical protein
LGALSIQTDPEGPRRIVWLTTGVTKGCAVTPPRLGSSDPSERAGHKTFRLVLHPPGRTTMVALYMPMFNLINLTK